MLNKINTFTPISKDLWKVITFLIFGYIVVHVVFAFSFYNYEMLVYGKTLPNEVKNRFIFLILLELSLLIFTIVSIIYVLNWLIIEPLKQLSDISDKILKGEKIGKLPRNSIVEIYNLANHLIKIKNYINSERHSKILIAEAREEAEQAILVAKEAKAAREEFLRKLRHELKNPLTTILGYAEIMIQEKFGKIPPKYKEAAENIFKSGYQMGTLMTNVLNRTEINTVSVINKCVSIHKDKAYFNNINYTSEIEGELPKIYVDEVRFKQILIGVIHHSLTLTPGGETIHITANSVMKGKKLDNLVIIVKDTGFGGTESFRKFSIDSIGPQGISRNSDGTDITIDSIRALLALHKGNLEINSVHGKGTTFTITIPYIDKKDNNFTPNGQDFSQFSNVAVLHTKRSS